MAQSRRVRQANGMVTKSTHGLTATTVKIGAYADKLDFVATPIAGYDGIILGKRWLAETGAVIDWKTNISHPCHVKGDRAPPQDVPIYHVSMATMRKMVRKQQPMFVANVRPAMDDEAATSDPLKPTNTQLSAANQQQLWQVLEQHQDTFKEPDGRREAPDGTQMRIRLQPGSTPPVKRLYRMSAAELQELQKQLADMLEKGWIRPSTSEYGSPVLFAPKPGGGLRLCVDFRALNALTVKDRYPLPRIDMLLDQLEGARYFTSLDLWSGYHQVGLHPEDMHLTAFNTRYGAFEYTVLPFGLANAPSAFMRLMNHTLRRHIDKSCVVYLDDVLIYSRTEEDHIRHVKEVLDTLREARLQVKLSKCSFAQPSTRFLGFRVSAEGISVDPKKVQAVQSWPPPHDLKSTRSYLGFTGFYRRFVPNYAKIAAPLTDLTRTSVPFPATLPEAALSAFRELQDRLTTAPLLVIPRTGPDATFVLHTDASDYGLGAVLLQDQGKGLQPVCYESRKLKASELNYAVHEKELLGVVHGVNAFRHYLEGCKSFTLKTDHHSLRYFLTQRDLSRRQARWSELLSDYSNNMTIEYTPGPTNHADALSRIFALQGGGVEINSLDAGLPEFAMYTLVAESELDAIRAAYPDDPFYADGSRPSYLTTRDGMYYFRDRLCVPADPTLRTRLLAEFHDSPSYGHAGYLRTLTSISRHFWWPRMTRTVKAYVESCPTCQFTKPSSQKPPGLLEPHAVPQRPFQAVSMDFITDLPVSVYDGREYDTIVTFVCMLTKRVLLARATKAISAKGTADVFLDKVYSQFGLPTKLVSDRDPRFTSEFWQTLMDHLGTTLNLSSAHHPECDGNTERAHRSLEQVLRAYVQPSHQDWARWLPLVEFSLNNSVSASTTQTPFYATLGFHPDTPATLIHPKPSVADYIAEMRSVQTVVARELELAKARQKELADRHRRPLTFRVGDKVRLSTEYVTLLLQPSKKLRSRFLGPFTVTKVISPVAYKLALPSTMSCHPVFHVSRLRPWHDNPDEFASRPEQPVPVAAGRDYIHGEAYQLDSILDVKIAPDHASRARVQPPCLFFKVRWAPPWHDPEHDSWEPLRGVSKTVFLQRFLDSPRWAQFAASTAYLTFAKSHPRKTPTRQEARS